METRKEIFPAEQKVHIFTKNSTIFFKPFPKSKRKILSGNGPAMVYQVGDQVFKEFKLKPYSKMPPEVFITSHVDHPHVMRGKVLIRKDKCYLVMPYFGIGTLRDIQFVLLKEEHDAIRKYILHQLLNALIYLAEQNIHHQDLHAGNILINDKAEIKIIDFGQANHLDTNKPIFGEYLYEGDEELNTHKSDHYVFCGSVLDAWAQHLEHDEWLLQVRKAMKTMELRGLKKLYAQLDACASVNQSDLQLFQKNLNVDAPKGCASLSAL